MPLTHGQRRSVFRRVAQGCDLLLSPFKQANSTVALYGSAVMFIGKVMDEFHAAVEI